MVGPLFACHGAAELGARVAAFISSGAFGLDRLSTRRTRARAAQPEPQPQPQPTEPTPVAA
ncbi:hypothetical protein ACTWJ9_23630 [Streptomyces sp. GDS52]|uniref:Uncharacterized protein n=1 Tax=Streptomyces cathayae TaxID=3031124 RepID=A0ABY8K5S6_9ACTN|nr:hypothetical protein [Streptomyces sp. HUAS 5]WGD43212.1 hypothetical protein PYS65_25490 [Streptomyces sp. HUAS 5]